MSLNQINLLSRNKFDSTTVGKISKWALSAGRWIVIITEVIVTAAFLSRFQLDRKNADLIREIEQKQPVLEAWATEEQQIRDIQSKLKTINLVLGQQYDYSQVIAEIGRSRPNGVYLTQIHITSKEVQIKGTAENEATIAGLEYQLNQSQLFKNIKISRINENLEADYQNTISFEITGVLQK